MTNQRISPFGRLRRPAGLIRWNCCYTTAWDTTIGKLSTPDENARKLLQQSTGAGLNN